jgi:hypothetical protein
MMTLTDIQTALLFVFGSDPPTQPELYGADFDDLDVLAWFANLHTFWLDEMNRDACANETPTTDVVMHTCFVRNLNETIDAQYWEARMKPIAVYPTDPKYFG